MSKRALSVLSIGSALALAACLGYSRQSSAHHPQRGELRNPIEQREQMIRELQEIKDLLKPFSGNFSSKNLAQL